MVMVDGGWWWEIDEIEMVDVDGCWWRLVVGVGWSMESK